MKVALFALLCLIWGSTWMVIKVGYGGLGPFNVAALRFFVAGVLCVPVVPLARARWPRGSGEWRLVTFVGVVLFGFDYGLIYWSEQFIDSGLTAEAAIERVQQRTRMRMREIDDPLLQERMHDLDDLANRLLRIVSGRLGTAAQLGLQGDSILIARNLGPAELLEYDRRRLKGVILEEGSLTAHVTIVARAMGVPMLGRVRNLRQLTDDRVYKDVEELARLQTFVAEGIKRFEYNLRRQAGAEADRAIVSGAEDVPPEFRSLVEEYYRSLSRARTQK